jgi:hypothetical protein
MGGYTRAVSGQQLGKEVPAATDKRNNRRTDFYVVRAEMLQTRGNVKT